jgi:hypothetical protein
MMLLKVPQVAAGSRGELDSLCKKTLWLTGFQVWWADAMRARCQRFVCDLVLVVSCQPVTRRHRMSWVGSLPT